MDDWNFEPPPQSALHDREVPRLGDHLEGRRVALLVTGGIAALKAPLVARGLRRYGADVVAFASTEGLRYVTEDALAWATTHPVVTRLTPAAEHLSDAAPFDAYLVAPATYNTINKIVHGIADTVVTAAIASAIGRMERGGTRVLVAPTMHGTLHNAILTQSLHKLRDLGVRIVPPRDDYGKHNIPETDVLVAEVIRAVSRSPLKGVPVLVTGGPTPVPIDSVRLITNRFTGKLGVEIAKELHLRGADVKLVHGGSAPVPAELGAWRRVRTYGEYRAVVREELEARAYGMGVFSAAVADYRPTEVAEGKIPSGGTLALELVPTAKVIDEVRERCPGLHMVTFKYQERIGHDELMEIAKKRLERFEAVVANRGEEVGPEGEQVAWLLVRGQAEPLKAVGKPRIAAAVADHLEAVARIASA
jgi:phosphopantothenoylcysteine decarboxylase / phosphopantothenate---cysteine ligase